MRSQKHLTHDLSDDAVQSSGIHAKVLPRTLEERDWLTALARLPLAVASYDSVPYILAMVARVMVPGVAHTIVIKALVDGEVRREHAYSEVPNALVPDDAAATERVLRTGEHHLDRHSLVVAIPSAGVPRAMTLVSAVPFQERDLGCASALAQWLAFALSTLVLDRAPRLSALQSAAVHDLMNPLTVVALNAAGLRDVDAAELDRRLALIERCARRMHDIAVDLLEDVRRGTDQLSLSLAWTYVTDLFEEATDAVRDEARHRDISLFIDASEASVNLVLCDRTRMVQVLVNLLDNAVKFTPPGGRITVGAARVNNRTRITVADNGQGIAPQDLSRIFDRYWRSSGGTGIGLANARAFTRAHDSDLAVSSILGAGTTFWFDLHSAE